MPPSSDGNIHASWAYQSTPGHPYTGRELVIRWDEGIRAKFVAWLRTKRKPITNKGYLRKSILSYLDRHFPQEGITRPEREGSSGPLRSSLYGEAFIC